MLDFTNTEYITFIDSIISSRGQWPDNLDCWEGHHIVPISFGGEGKTKEKHTNIIRLTPGEHFKAHKLLALSFPEVPAFQQAFYIMANTFKVNSSRSNQRSFEISEEDFELARKLYLEAVHKDPSISGNNRGRTVVCNDVLRIKRHLRPEEVDAFLESNPDWRLGGLRQTEEERLKRKGLLAGEKNPMYGRKYTDEMRAKRRETVKGKKWFTNGINDIYCRPEDAPEGYYKGSTHSNSFGRGENNPMWGKTSATGKKVKCLNTGEVFESKRKASFALPISIPMIDRSIASNGPVKNRAGELYQFEYVD